MRINFRVYYLLIFFTTFATQVKALKNGSDKGLLKLITSHSISDGLSHNGVTSILEDSKGFMWFGTYDGLTLYDGFKYRNFKNTVNNKPLVSNRIRSLAEDSKGNIWLGTDAGVSIYDYENKTFSPLIELRSATEKRKAPKVRSVLLLNNGKVVCLSENSGLYVFNSNYRLELSIINDENGEPLHLFRALPIDSSNLIAVTSTGIIHINLKNKLVKTIYRGYMGLDMQLVQLKNKQVLFSLHRGLGIFSFTSKNDSISFSVPSLYLEKFHFGAIALDKHDNLWAGVPRLGLVQIKNIHSSGYLGEENISTKFKPALKSLRPSIIYMSDNTGCWFGTYDQGIFRFNLEESSFKWYHNNTRRNSSPQIDYISSIKYFDSNRVLVKSEDRAAVLFDPMKDEFSSLPNCLTTEELTRASDFQFDESGNLWFMLQGMGLCAIFRGNNHYESVTHSVFPELDYFKSRLMILDSKGSIWIGGENEVYRVRLNVNLRVSSVESLTDNSFFKNVSFERVRTFYLDPDFEILWVGTDEDGLFRVHLDESMSLSKLHIDQYMPDDSDPNSISSNFVTSIVRQSDSVLWIGTERGGICKVTSDNEELKFHTLHEEHGLSDNVVKNIIIDKEDNLWIPTNIGLSKFDTRTNKFRRFTKQDGLPFLDFVYSGAILKSGFIVLANEHGFCYFDPDNLPLSSPLPRVHFDELTVLGDKVLPNDSVRGRVIIEKRLDQQRDLTLLYNENVFSIDAIALHYGDPNNHMLRYKLKPINDEWIQTPSSQFRIYYNGLQPGSYQMEVSASNAHNQWTTPKTLNIEILPPPWLTREAFFAYFILLILVILILVYFVTKIQKLRHSVEIEHLEGESSRKLNEAKLRFFSNISHEIKTPLTLISGPVSVLRSKFSNDSFVKDKLDIIERQSKKMSQLVDQVNDFQRSDANLLQLGSSNFYFNEFILNLLKDFEFLAKNENKHLSITQPNENIHISADKEKLEKIINNLMSNAFKFTNPGDNIDVEYYADGKDLVINVSDTGLGIKQEDLPKIFERFYQTSQTVERNAAGSGIGLAFAKRLVDMHYGYIEAQSEHGEGSQFKVRLPVITEQVDVLAEERKEQIREQERKHHIPEYSSDIAQTKEPEVNPEYKSCTLFLAEDNVEMRLFISDILKNHYQIRAFENGKKCLEAMAEEWPDVILSDVMMPELDGFDLCKTLKNDIKTSHIPIILLTARVQIEDEIKGLSDGADAYIKKPFDIKHLITTINSLLKNRKQLRDRFEIDLPLELKSDQIGKDSVFLEKLYALMNENLSNGELNLDDFAKELYLNRTHFYQKVKALTNQTPFELLKGFRLKMAAEFLMKGLSVNEVYMMTGFRSRAHFSRSFKAQFDVTPGKYAEKQKSRIQLS